MNTAISNNRYLAASQKKALLKEIDTRQETRGSAGNSVKEMGKDLLIGVIGGGLLSAILDKKAFWAGLLISGTGYYRDSRALTALGLGMMANGGYKMGKDALSGLDGLDGVKERLLAFRDSMLERTYLDRLIKLKKNENAPGAGSSKPLSVASNGVGEITYFNWPDANLSASLDELNAIEDSIAGIAMDMDNANTGMGDFGDYSSSSYETVGDLLL
jgi:hypothetical protein